MLVLAHVAVVEHAVQVVLQQHATLCDAMMRRPVAIEASRDAAIDSSCDTGTAVAGARFKHSRSELTSARRQAKEHLTDERARA